jgi:N-acetylglucosaminyldiphosphoundecaprenol N-acetyl-beta-D-mannosaminyltransferase
MIIEAYNDSSFAEVLDRADLVTPDGMPLVVVLQSMYGIHQDRVAGMDLLPALIAKAADYSIPVFFYGSSNEVLARIVTRAIAENPKLRVVGTHSPPYRTLNHEENALVLNHINDSGAGIVFVALGCPKQEQWMSNNKSKVNAVMIGLGGAFPVYATLQSRAPKWMQRYSLEWLYRLIQEPRRLLFRYLYTNSVFVILLLKYKLTKMVHKSN